MKCHLPEELTHSQIGKQSLFELKVDSNIWMNIKTKGFAPLRISCTLQSVYCAVWNAKYHIYWYSKRTHIFVFHNDANILIYLG